eukprot:gnl/MRDRNA2_/MRDRNA2_91793_c0_seq1.p1 gnl/MRDRNA2_/MRDRNA2_91793_c0~~gnl/MRDRNA2_/MRDRNA2_91793_c0_seq1.p1  ORF type:complete len:213 (+),score=57.82 gnl/MRDRNA2_/MRDRNA2_91793_c0_seq1:92-730(+)
MELLDPTRRWGAPMVLGGGAQPGSIPRNQHSQRDAVAQRRALRRISPKMPPSERQLADEQLEELKAAFDVFDVRGKGTIDARELKGAMRALGLESSKAELPQILASIGKDNESKLSFSEFCAVLRDRVGQRSMREETERVFALFERRESGKITLDDLRSLAKEACGSKLTDADLALMISEADLDGDGAVSQEDFYRFMRSDRLPGDVESDSD